MAIHHCGTNEEIIKYSGKESPTTEIMVSSIVTRGDLNGIDLKVTDLKGGVNAFCRINRLKVIENGNLDATWLSQMLHLNRKGTGYLVHNLLSFIIEY